MSLLPFRTPLAANLRYGMARQQTAVYRKVAARWPRLSPTPEGGVSSRAALTLFPLPKEGPAWVVAVLRLQGKSSR